MSSSLSTAEARRMALAAQGFSESVSLALERPFDSTLERLHVLQIDSVNVFARSHYMPMFSRHGSYDQGHLDGHLWSSGEFTEYWAHEAAFIKVEDRPLFGWRMHDFRQRHAERAKSLAPVLDRVRRQLTEGGPQFVRDLEVEPRRPREPWWDWSDTKRAVEVLFAVGEVVSTGRERFERRYALANDVLPAASLREISREAAQRTLIEQAARSLGVGTLNDFADYHRMKTAEARVAVRALEDEGTLVPVQVEGWVTPQGRSQPAWRHHDAQLPDRLEANALLTPFDPVVWFRPRAERMFDFHYRIEIYTPKAKRQFGYYCLPLMVGGNLVGRIDLKADRANRDLLVQAAWQEPDAPAHTAETAAQLLVNAARWQGLQRVVGSGAGNLALPTTLDVE